jgi:hypothetical protein
VTSGTLFGSDAISGGTFAFTDKNVGSGNKTVTASGVTVTDGNSGGNYNVSYASNTTSTISQANLTLSTSNVSKTYDGSLIAAGTATVTSGTLFGSDAISGGTFAFIDKNVGSGNKTVTASGITVTDGNSGGNYNVSYADNTASTIVAKALTVSGQSASNKVYDGSTTATLTGGTLAGVLSGESVTLTEAGNFATADVGAGIAVTAADSIAGSDAGNYSVTQPTGLSADITAAVTTTTDTDPRVENAIAHALAVTPNRPLPLIQFSNGPIPGGLVGLNLSVTGGGINLPAGFIGSDDEADKK